ncbi:MAG: hypothetical protein O3C27_16930 [Actinomycetota bacterium]|nr:hypothetical protein [Actinomycetota bacterium]
MTDNGDLEPVIAAFSDAETALVQLAERSERASGIAKELAQARADIEQLRDRLRRDFAEELVAAELKSAERTEEQVNVIRSATVALTSAAATSNERETKELAILAQAGEILDSAGTDLTTAERTLANARSDIREMILIHSDISRELKLAATALASLRPERMALKLDEIQETVSSTQAALVQSLEAANTAQAQLIASRMDTAAQTQQILAKRLRWVIALLTIVLLVVVGSGVAALLN